MEEDCLTEVKTLLRMSVWKLDRRDNGCPLSGIALHLLHLGQRGCGGGWSGQHKLPAPLPSGKRSDTRRTGGLVGLGTGLEGCGQSLPSTGVRAPDNPALSELHAGRQMIM